MSTSALQKQVFRFVSNNLSGFTILENHRPDWLKFNGFNLELDIFIPELDIAIEVQGQQHYRFIKYFHNTYGGFQRQQQRDEFKREKCSREGILLFEIGDWLDFEIATSEIIEIVTNISDKIEVINSLIKRYKYTRSLKSIIRKIHTILNQLEQTNENESKAVLDAQLQLYQNKLGELFTKIPDELRASIIKKSNSLFSNKEKIKQNKRLRKKRKRCGHLKIHPVSTSLWIVWGGRHTHAVEIVDGKLICDCSGAEQAKPMCSHCEAITRHLNGNTNIKFIESIENYS